MNQIVVFAVELQEAILRIKLRKAPRQPLHVLRVNPQRIALVALGVVDLAVMELQLID